MTPRSPVLRIHPDDTVLVALADLAAGTQVQADGTVYTLTTDVRAKHKFATRDLAVGDPVQMYGTLVGRARVAIRQGEVLTPQNLHHAAAPYQPAATPYAWTPPDVSRWQHRTFDGYHRSDGQVGTANYWLVVPLVFCENRNVDVLRQAFAQELGFAQPDVYRQQVARLVASYRKGDLSALHQPVVAEVEPVPTETRRVFEHLDGVQFLTHEGGCGGTREDARTLCALIAGYLHHPNVAGATVLSLGCQHAQVSLLQEEIARRNPQFDKPLLVFEQQRSRSERALLADTIRETFLGLVEADRARRQPASLAHLTLGLKCGGSDGFSGLSANPAIGHTSDLLVALGGKALLAEFPELCGVEQMLIDRCVRPDVGERFVQLMRRYAARAAAVGSGFDMNPSPGNIRDGLITDAMKSAGAARKGGTAPITAGLDYPEYATEAGLHLLCTPGNDLESVTGMVGAGASVVLFTTGLGTPTGNPIAPVVKLATNTALTQRMPDLIDFDCGGILTGAQTLEQTGEAILELVIEVASGRLLTKAQMLGQDDFIPWKQGVSL